MHGNSTRRLVVASGGDQVVGHVGLHALGAFADRLGLGNALSARIPPRGERMPLHDRGKVLVQSMLMLAGGGESCADIEHLRAQEDLFGSAPSDSTVFRTFHEISPEVRDALAEAFAQVRAEVWRRSAATTGTAPVILDIDASLVEIHTETKEGTGPHYKGGWGFHPMFCFADVIGEALSGLLRPGNAGANTVADHVLRPRRCGRPAARRRSPRAIGPVTTPHSSPVPSSCAPTRRAAPRASSMGRRARNVGFFVVARSNAQVHSAIFDTVGLEEIWEPALHQDGSPREGAAVAELTELVDLSEWPEGTRLIVRREPLHPGAQHSLFPSLEYRYWGHYTDQDGDPVQLDLTMRAHAHVEQHIERLKDSGLLTFPFSDLEANRTWMASVMMAADLVRWFQLLCLDGTWAKAQPKALRWGIFHAPGRLVRTGRRHLVRILSGWPSADALLGAYRRLELIV